MRRFDIEVASQPGDRMIHCYGDKLSARAGEKVQLHISSSSTDCSIEVARIGRAHKLVLAMPVSGLQDQPIPQEPSRNGCDWPVSAELEIGDWSSGYYDIQLTNAAGDVAHHFVCVKPTGARRKAALILATNTYQAYNSWGGYNAYCNVGGVMDGSLTLAEGTLQGIGILSRKRPFSPGIAYAPESAARLINGGSRGFEELPRMVHREFYYGHGMSGFDSTAGYVNKWEHYFVAWAEDRGIEFDFFTDYDIETEAGVLADYNAAIVVGHSEYWSGPQRDAIDDYVDNGGNFIVLSGNTCFWKVRWEDDGDTLICHKHKGLEAEPDAGNDATQLWSHPQFNKPEAALIGLTFLYGGYHQFGMCVARGSSAYTVYDDQHWVLEGSDLLYGDQFGGDVPLLGFENDGCLLNFGEDGKLKSVPRLGVPANLEIIAIAPAAYGEDKTRGYPRIVNPEDFDLAATLAFGEATEETRNRLIRGHAVMAAMHRGKGQVFNGGTTEWAHGLRADNPFVSKITENVLQRFGAI